MKLEHHSFRPRSLSAAVSELCRWAARNVCGHDPKHYLVSGGNMRRVILFMIAGLCMGSVSVGQTGVASTKAVDPIVGSWKMNISSSTISPALQQMFKDAPPKQRIEVYRLTPNRQIELTTAFTGTDGSSISSKVVYPAEGGMAQDTISQPGESLVETRISPREWYVTFMQDGKQTLTMHKVISTDGKTMRQTVTGVDSQGKAFEEVRVYERQ
jgi:hypothetical protein